MKKIIINFILLSTLLFIISGCIVPIPYVWFKSGETEKKSKKFSCDVPKLISALPDTLVAKKFKIDTINTESGEIAASSNMSMVDKGISLNPIKPSIGLSATFTSLKLTAGTEKISSMETKLTIEIDYKSDDISILIDKIFEDLESRLAGKYKKYKKK